MRVQHTYVCLEVKNFYLFLSPLLTFPQTSPFRSRQFCSRVNAAGLVKTYCFEIDGFFALRSNHVPTQPTSRPQPFPPPKSMIRNVEKGKITLRHRSRPIRVYCFSLMVLKAEGTTARGDFTA